MHKDTDPALKEAKKMMMHENEKLFKMHFSSNEGRRIIAVPKEVPDHVLSFSVNLDLQDKILLFTGPCFYIKVWGSVRAQNNWYFLNIADLLFSLKKP
ncbi:MAG: hypothetical protein H0V82_03255 [Candidatus Protochlamydia sp.]|nr:hypothetical protein [Candidatus Protochlamydia sp.]